MSGPNSSWAPSQHFLDALYDKEEEIKLQIKQEVVESEENDEESDEEDYSEREVLWPKLVWGESRNSPPQDTSPSRSPKRKQESSDSPWRERSRSPLQTGTSSIIQQREGVIVRHYDKYGYAPDPVQEDAITPDEHSLLEVREVKPNDVETETWARGGRRGSRGVRGTQSGRGGGRGRRGDPTTRPQVIVPLTEVYHTDDDIPEDLVDLINRQQECKLAEARLGIRIKEEVGDENLLAVKVEQEFFHPADADFLWSSMDSFRPVEEPFAPVTVGPAEWYHSPYSAFRSFWDDGILQHIAQEANEHASKITSSAFHADWVPTNYHEILVMFSFWMMLGIIRMPTIKSCFSLNPLLETTVFRRMFTRRRYETLVQCLNFVDGNESRDVDRMSRIRPILTYLNEKFQTNYTPSKDICINESHNSRRRRLDIGQAISTKSIRTFDLCESVTGYLWSFFVCTSDKNDTSRYSKLPTSTAAVLTLMEPLLNKGYRLFMDGWYNSPILARYLKRNGTDCVGTLRPDLPLIPPFLSLARLGQGEMVGRHSGDVCVMAWQDKTRDVTISTCHGLAQGLATVSSAPTKDVFKPQVVLDYEKFMGGVDLKDDMLEPYLLERKRCLKLFKRLLNCSINNSRILLEASTKGHHDNIDFRLRLVEEILANHLAHCPVPRAAVKTRHGLPTPTRNVESHFPVRVPQTAGDSATGRQSRKQCFWCFRNGRKTKKTPYKCEQCDVPLCVEGCFKSYHLV